MLFRAVVFVSILAAVLGMLFVANLFALSPIADTNISVSPGYRSLSLDWENVAEASFYAVYRSDDSTSSVPACIALTRDSLYTDDLLIPGMGYKYIVLYGDNLAALETQVARDLDWANATVHKASLIGPLDTAGQPVESPHKGATVDANSKNSCSVCHQAHDSANPKLVTSSGASSHET